MRDWISGKLRIDTLVSIALGIVFLLIVLILRLMAPRVEGMAIERAIQVTLALSAAGIATGIPGLLNSSMDIKSPRKAFTIKITGGLVVFLVVFAVHPKPAQTVAAIELLLIFLTPLLLRHSLRRYRVRLSKASLTVLTALVMAAAAALFSELVGGRTLALASRRSGAHGCLLRSGPEWIPYLSVVPSACMGAARQPADGCARQGQPNPGA